MLVTNMRLNNRCFSSLTFLLLPAFLTFTPVVAQSHTSREKILVGFSGNGSAGNQPSGGLIADAAGNFYGVTTAGGIKGNGLGNGTVYEVSPAANGGWKTKALYLFHTGTQDGQDPIGGLVMDSAGNLYGTTSQGGPNLCNDGFDNPVSCGTVFELSPNSSGGWMEKIIYNFGQDAWLPAQSLIIDASGNLYGTTARNSDLDHVGGTVFELQRNGDEWIRTTLHTFGDVGDGAGPSSPMIFDKAGNLYGETAVSGELGGGTVFKLTNTGSGSWQEQTLFNFVSTSTLPSGGSEPNGGLIFDSAGNLYGTTNVGGIRLAQGCGVVFQLTPTNGGTWNEAVLYQFLCNQYGMADPEAGLVADSAGNLYGTTGFGGSANTGNAFELKRSANGAWTYFDIYTFQGYPGDGNEPNSSLLFDSKGNLYGTTAGGGSGGGGTLFEIAP